MRRQRFPDGLLTKPWDASLVALVAIATGAILYDGLSQTQAFFDLFSIPDLAASTLLLTAFLAIIVALALGVGARIGMTAIGAGLLPNNVGTLAGWVASTQHLKPGNLMPAFPMLSGQQLRAVAAYLSGLD